MSPPVTLSIPICTKGFNSLTIPCRRRKTYLLTSPMEGQKIDEDFRRSLATYTHRLQLTTTENQIGSTSRWIPNPFDKKGDHEVSWTLLSEVTRGLLSTLSSPTRSMGINIIQKGSVDLKVINSEILYLSESVGVGWT